MRRAILAVILALPLAAHATDVHVRVSPDVKTGIDSTTEFPTIQNALDHHPFATPNSDGTAGRVFIEIAPGTYHERIIVTQNHTNITLLGIGKSPEDTVITNALNAKTAGGTFFTETAEINGDGFEADNLTFENAAGNTGQAVAAAVRADRAVFKHCRFLGDQDTLFADFGRQYYVDSYIEGGVDFIFGNAAAVFDRDEIHEIRNGYLTAQSRASPDQSTGFVIVDSRVTNNPLPHPVPPRIEGPGPPAAPKYSSPYNDGVLHSPPLPPMQPPKPPTPAPPVEPKVLYPKIFFLGRPWRPYSRVIVMNTELPAALNPAGWSKWKQDDPTPQAFYAEYNNTGPGASASSRAPWSHQLTAKQAEAFAPANFLSGPDHWNPIVAAAKLP